MYLSQTHFGFTNMGSKVDRFRVISSQRVKNGNKLRHAKRILALPTWGQRYIFTELLPFQLGNFDFDLGHQMKKSSIIGLEHAFKANLHRATKIYHTFYLSN